MLFIRVVFGVFVFSYSFFAFSNDDCIPAKEFVEYPSAYRLGMYQRVDPDGRYVLHSQMQNSSPVVLMDLNNRDENGIRIAKPILTPMNNEVYPATSDWKLFASPDHGESMHYYSLDEIKKKQVNSEPIFVDASHNQLYHSVGELPGSTPNSKKIRVTLWGNRLTKEYDVSLSKGEVTGMKGGRVGAICDNLVTKKISNEEEIQIQNKIKQFAELNKKIQAIGKISEDPPLYRNLSPDEQALKRSLRSERLKLSRQIDQARRLIEFDAPVLSPDGQEVASLSGPSGAGEDLQNLKIFKINPDLSCTQVEDLGFKTGKVQFSFPEQGKKGQLAFLGAQKITSTGGVQEIFVYDRDQKKLKRIYQSTGDIGYPGFTRNGKIIFPTCLQKERMKIADNTPDAVFIAAAAAAAAAQALQGGVGYSGSPINDHLEKGLQGQSSKIVEVIDGSMGAYGQMGLGGMLGNANSTARLPSVSEKESVSPRCGAVIVDPNQLNESGEVDKSSTKCINYKGRLISRMGHSSSRETSKKAQRATK